MPVRGQTIDGLRQFRAQSLHKLVPRHADLAGECIECFAARGLFNIARRDWLVRSMADPRLRRTAKAILLEALEQFVQPAADDVSGGAAGKRSSQSALKPRT